MCFLNMYICLRSYGLCYMLQSWIACKKYCLKEEINLKLMFLDGCDVLENCL